MEVKSLFVTPVCTHVWPDCNELNTRLRELILEDERRTPDRGSDYSSIGGWHSPLGLERSADPAIRTTIGRVRQLLDEVTTMTVGLPRDEWRVECDITAWATINRAHDYNMPHWHRCTWAAVYYVAVPPLNGDPRAGSLELLDPRPAAAMVYAPGSFFTNRHYVHPEPGMMVLMPGWLTHLVHPFTGPGERITISCNIAVTDAYVLSPSRTHRR